MTAVAFVAVIVSLEALPAVIEAGVAVMVTVGAAVDGGLGLWLEPHPAIRRTSDAVMNLATGERRDWNFRQTRTFIMDLYCSGERGWP